MNEKHESPLINKLRLGFTMSSFELSKLFDLQSDEKIQASLGLSIDDRLLIAKTLWQAAENKLVNVQKACERQREKYFALTVEKNEASAVREMNGIVEQLSDEQSEKMLAILQATLDRREG